MQAPNQLHGFYDGNSLLCPHIEIFPIMIIVEIVLHNTYFWRLAKNLRSRLKKLTVKNQIQTTKENVPPKYKFKKVRLLWDLNMWDLNNANIHVENGRYHIESGFSWTRDK